PRLLTFMTDEPGAKEWYEYPSVLQIFRRLGYRTYWISNQEYSGRWSNLSSILSADADVLEYVGSMDSDDHFLYRYDDVLLPEWKSALNAPDSLQMVFLHLMGSHFQYENRFPASRRRFRGSDVQSRLPRKWLDSKKAGVVADYDNSILFTDSILVRMMADVCAMREPAVLIYLSDHGDDVYDDRDYRGRDPKFVDVPFVICANEAYRQRNPEIMKAMAEAAHRPFSTSELPQIILGLTGTAYHFYDSVRDPVSSRFAPRRRWVDDTPYHTDSP
ncbi:MAG: sulfatase-like hydrolase/transferase, partial [Muribaculaceae bacterium]|nr:sulfatase-like hydrolase/transferase [Muribaculaceae bacterium]